MNHGIPSPSRLCKLSMECRLCKWLMWQGRWTMSSWCWISWWRLISAHNDMSFQTVLSCLGQLSLPLSCYNMWKYSLQKSGTHMQFLFSSCTFQDDMGATLFLYFKEKTKLHIPTQDVGALMSSNELSVIMHKWSCILLTVDLLTEFSYHHQTLKLKHA